MRDLAAELVVGLALSLVGAAALHFVFGVGLGAIDPTWAYAAGAAAIAVPTVAIAAVLEQRRKKRRR